MDGRQFDALTRVVSQGGSRRQVLRRLGVSVVALALPLLGREPASAKYQPCDKCCAKQRRDCTQRCGPYPVILFNCVCAPPGSRPTCNATDCTCDINAPI
jgi:hypothetical protein